MPTFKDLNQETKIIKKLKKAGLSLAILFSKEDIQRFNLSYDKEIDISSAEILEKKDI